MSQLRNIFYAQSGGVTSVINASACGVIEAARDKRRQIGKVFAGRNGIIGALTEDLIDTSLETKKNIAGLLHTPSGAFGSCRYKLRSSSESRAEYQRLIDIFRAHNVGYFFYNGGGDSADTCLKVSQISQTMGYPIQAIHIPKTIDNDLPITDSCPGFGSVAKYVAVSTREASFDVASMAKTSTKIFIFEVMGRHAGWIAAAGAMASINSDLPIIILFPEIAFSLRNFINAVQKKVKRFGFCSIVVSEGARNSDGSFLADQGSQDAFGHAQLGGVAPVVAGLIKKELNLKYHWAVADYLQRSARHIASKTDVEHAYAVGEAAVSLALKGKNSVMASIYRTSNDPYRWKITEAPLTKIANREKMMPRSFISRDGFGITARCREYLAPLILGEDYPPFKNGLPDYQKLKNISVKKKLKEEFSIS
tara:strand:+ start:1068 stop:2333 length:1266 start_codon:yes stop_codon:yes gene_type:complete